MQNPAHHKHNATLSDTVLDCILRTGPPAQFGDDWTLLPTLLQLRRRRFVEIGAYRGISLSNTFMLERCFNWTGVLIEANPKNYAVLQTAGRSRSRLVHSAVCDGDGSTGSTVPMTVDGMAVAGQLGAMSQRYIHIQRKGDNISDVVHVPCRSLQSILDDKSSSRGSSGSSVVSASASGGSGGDGKSGKGALASTFGLLSLDVEGAEDLIIRTVDPSAFSLIVVEADGYDPPKDRRVHERILAAGLRLSSALRVPKSSVYVRPEVREELWPIDGRVWRGFCDTTTVVSERGECEAGASQGAWPMRHGSPLGIIDVPSCVAHCQRACGDRCRFVSVSHKHRDCSWYDACSRWGQSHGLGHHFSVRVGA